MHKVVHARACTHTHTHTHTHIHTHMDTAYPANLKVKSMQCTCTHAHSTRRCERTRTHTVHTADMQHTPHSRLHTANSTRMHSLMHTHALPQAVWTDFPEYGHWGVLCLLQSECVTTCLAGGGLQDTPLASPVADMWPCTLGLLLGVGTLAACARTRTHARTHAPLHTHTHAYTQWHSQEQVSTRAHTRVRLFPFPPTYQNLGTAGVGGCIAPNGSVEPHSCASTPVCPHRACSCVWQGQKEPCAVPPGLAPRRAAMYP